MESDGPNAAALVQKSSTTPHQVVFSAGSPTSSITSPPSSSVGPSDYDADVSSKSITPTLKDGVPVDFAFPKAHRESIMICLSKKQMPPDVRNAFVRELIVHMYSYGGRPSRIFCSFVARRIILKYPFLRDAAGNGFVSVMILYLLNTSFYPFVNRSAMLYNFHNFSSIFQCST